MVLAMSNRNGSSKRTREPDGSAHRGGAGSFLQLSPDAVLVVDDAGVVLDTNEEADQLFAQPPQIGSNFGVPSSDKAGWSILDIVTPEGHQQMQARTRNVRWSGSRAHVIALRPVAPMVSTSAGLAEGLAEVRHDLDNAITIARGYASTLELHWDALPEGTRADFLGRIAANLDAVADLAADLVDASSGPRTPTRLPVSLRDLVADAVAAAPTDVVVDVDVDEPAARLLADRTHARRILRNLIGNAVRHGAPPLRLSTASSADAVVIRISDAGNGISAAVGDQLFARGVSGGGSTGLGLHVARELARSNKGELTCDDPQPGQGATFRLRLPRLATSLSD